VSQDSSSAPHGTIPQQALLAAVVASSFDAVISKSLDGVILSWNAAAERIFGYSAAEAIGRPVTMLLPPDRQDEESFILERLCRGEAIQSFETERVRKDGRTIQVSVTSSPVRDATGQVVGASKIVRDISEALANVTALAQQQERLQGIVESAMDAIVTVDQAGRIVVFNVAASKMFDCPASMALGQPLDQFLPHRFRAGHADKMREFGASGRSNRAMGRAGEIWGLRRNGDEFPLEASISHVHLDGGVLYTVIMRDVSELKKARSDRNALESQLREAQKMEAIGTLAGGIAHDFNNMIASILGNAGLAREQLANGQSCLPLIDQIDRAANRARSVVRQILAFSRHQPQARSMQPLEPIVDEALGLLRATLPATVRLNAHLQGEGLCAVVDSTQLHQVLLNLGTNAWQALRGSTGRIEVGLEGRQLDSSEAMQLGALPAGLYAHLWVRDNGCGIDEGVRARIFEPFFTTKPRGEGTGLGLSVVHGIVVDHLGAISLESSPGRGSTFHIYLPGIPARPGAAKLTEQATPAPVDGRGRRVMYIDDDDVMVMMVDRLLTRSGFAPTCFGEAHIALAELRADSAAYDVVVSDYNMPDKTGLEVAREVAEMAPAMKIVITSGYIPAELRIHAEAAGITLFEKERTFEELPALLTRVLDIAKSPDQLAH
jgi:PAS domain S-box-containing protein